MINFLLLAVLAGVAYYVANEGPQGAAISLISVILAGLVAMNFFEPVAAFLEGNIFGTFEWQHRWDVVTLLGVFAVAVTVLRMMGEKLLPTYAEVNPLVYEISRWSLGAVTGYITMAILLTALHVAPLPREFMGFTPEGKNFLSMAAPDRQWLAFTQYVSEKSMRGTPARIFDGAMFPANPTDPNTQRVWSSFPIRYAARRERYTTGGRPSATSGSPGVAPPAGGGSAPPAPVSGAGGF